MFYGIINMIAKKNSYILFALPAVLLFLVIVVIPLLFTVVFSFTEWRRFNIIKFGTFEHYIRSLSDPVLGKAFIHNFLYILFTIFLESGTGLLLAGIVIHLKRSIIYRSLFFSPIILPSIVVGVLWRQIYAYHAGLLNSILTGLGGKDIDWLSYPFTMISVSIVSGWLFAGFFMTIFYAGLARIPDSIIESAKLDGASASGIFLKIELPLIKNLIMLALLIVTTGGFKGFDLFQILLRRDPLESGIVLPVFLVRTFFENQDIGYGSAVSMLLTLVVIAIIIVINFINKIFVGRVEEF
ncbi:MAG: sugar ABC transporter permease [Spirochaetes bacterium]|nr:sugar ABC transporter permease [Spirochaetota bacterium]